MEAFFGFLKVAFICATAVLALIIVLLALPRSPLRDLVLKLTQRVGATVVGGGLMVPDLALPVAGEIADVAIVIFVIWYWYTFFKQLNSGGDAATQRRIASREDD
ncbi:MAG: hypothetical protein QOJ39_2632, partial [Candidatus Eremiobacteraeota bacterium]|nr:hypothetical protein [Candidatus Eremiobacteraeota bacterium]